MYFPNLILEGYLMRLNDHISAMIDDRSVCITLMPSRLDMSSVPANERLSHDTYYTVPETPKMEFTKRENVATHCSPLDSARGGRPRVVRYRYRLTPASPACPVAPHLECVTSPFSRDYTLGCPEHARAALTYQRARKVPGCRKTVNVNNDWN